MAIWIHDSPLAEVLDPPLTVVKMPLYEMGRRAAEMLISLLEDRPLSGTAGPAARTVDRAEIDSAVSRGTMNLCL